MKKTLLMIGALIAACAVAALSAYGALQAQASAAPSHAAGATHPASKTARGLVGGNSALSPGVQELARNEGLGLSALKQVAIARGQHPAVVFAASKGTSTCAYLTGGTGAVGGCMHLGDNLVAPRIAIVDGGTYLWGLAAGTVDRVQAQLSGQTFTGALADGIFTVEISDGSNGTGPIDLLVTSGTSTTTISLPGIPKAMPRP
jgi:hypothetical protein